MLSNTATPRYYGEFKNAVLRGETPINQYIAMEMARIDELIANPNYYYDDQAVEGWIKYCENELTLTDGSDVNLLPSFKLWGEQLYGWYYYTDKSVYVPGIKGSSIDGHYEYKRTLHRLVKKQYIIVARGGAKSMYDSFIQSYGLNCDKQTTDGVVTAPTMRQAEETTSPIKTSIVRAKGPLFKFLTEGSIQNTTGDRLKRIKLASTKKGIENFLTNSIIEIRPMSIDKLQGLRCKYATVDEWLSGDTREDVIAAIEQGASKLDDYIIVATSSEGTVRNGPGDTIKMELMSILKGEYYAPHISIWYYRLDDIKEVKDPSMWIKANPNLGITVSYEAYQLDVERAEANPSVRNEIIAKRFGIPMEGYTYFFTYEQTLCHRKREFWNMACALGIDLSQGDDFCAFTFLFPLGGDKYGVKALSFITEDTLYNLPLAARTKYDEFINEGTLIVMNSSVLDLDQVFDLLTDHIEKNMYSVHCVGYDPYNAKGFIERWEQENGPYGIEKVIQGSRTESVPLGELRKLAEKRNLLFDQSIMNYCMGNCITIEDTNGNRKLLKMRYEAKIDNVSALMDAWVAYKLNLEAFD
jgi:phage terminase large subunit-like protein